MKCSWSSSELELEIKGNISDEAIKQLSVCNPMYEHENIEDLKNHISNGNSFKIYPSSSNLFICDDEFIRSCTSPIALFKYYEKKMSKGKIPLTIHTNNDAVQIETLEYCEESNQIFQKLLETIIVDVGSLKKSLIATPPEIFSRLSKYHDNSKSYCKYLSEFLSLLSISDRVIALDENLNTFEFQIFTKESVKRIRHSWLDLDSLSNGYWFTCYQWITSEGQKSIDINLKRHIVREGITKYYNEDSYKMFDETKTTELVLVFDNIFKIIVSGRTQEYFETQKVLKGEYIEIYSKNFDALSNVVSAILALIVALAAGIYGVLFAQGSNLDLFSPNKSVGVLFILMFIAEVFVLLSSKVKINSHKSYLEKLKKINTEKLMISEEDQTYFSIDNSDFIPFIYQMLTVIIIVTIIGVFWFMRGTVPKPSGTPVLNDALLILQKIAMMIN